ncbi:MAG: glycosyltransferase family 4 protein [Gemmatimonadetes bacterium]|nr:glycosyltransferase family 4 protein [Gemmatimonadota bacterium]
MTLQKGPDYFLEAARRVLEHDPEVRFILAGAGDFWVPLIERAATLGIGDRVLFTGFVSREDVPDLMAMADLFVMPSVSEPFGLVALEAMEAGVPVLISRQSGVGEVVQHVLKADFWDIDDLAAKILAVLSYPELAQAIGRAGEEESRARTLADVAREVDSLYHEVRDVPATLPFAVPQPC